MSFVDSSVGIESIHRKGRPEAKAAGCGPMKREVPGRDCRKHHRILREPFPYLPDLPEKDPD